MASRLSIDHSFRRISVPEAECIYLPRRPVTVTGPDGHTRSYTDTRFISDIGKDSRAHLGAGLIWEGDYDIVGRADLLRLSGYICVTGNLTIRSRSLINLEGLEYLGYVGGDLKITNTSVTDLDGLSGLHSIGGSLRIEGNKSLREIDSLTGFAQTVRDIVSGRNEWCLSNEPLTSLGGLTSLATIGGDLRIGDNSSLINLHGLESLKSVTGSVSVWANDSLKTLVGLRNLRGVGGHLELWGNRALPSLNGLQSLASIGGDLSIGMNGFGNDSLCSIDGLEGLRSISGNLSIRNNPLLKNLNGLSGLDVIRAGLCIADNIILEDLDGLSNIACFEGSNIQISDNEHLASCDAEDLRQRLTRGEFLTGPYCVFAVE